MAYKSRRGRLLTADRKLKCIKDWTQLHGERVRRSKSYSKEAATSIDPQTATVVSEEKP